VLARLATWATLAALAACGPPPVAGDDHGVVDPPDPGPATPEIEIGHIGAITALAATADGRTVAFGLRSGLVLLWDARDDRLVRRLAGHAGRVAAVAFADAGARLASAGEDGAAVVWDTATGAELHRHEWLPELTTIALGPDGQLLLTGGIDGVVRIQPLGGGDDAVLLDHESQIRAMALVTAGDRTLLLTGDDDGVALVRDLATRKVLHRFQVHSERVVQAVALAVTATGTVRAAAAAKDEILLWDLPARGAAVALPPLAHAGWIDSLAFARGGDRLAAGSARTVRLYDVAAGTARELTGRLRHDSDVSELAFTAAGLLATDLPGAAILYDAASGAQIGQLGGRAPTVRMMARSADGRVLALPLRTGQLLVWRLDREAPVQVIDVGRELTSVALHPSRPLAACVSAAGTNDVGRIELVDLDRGRIVGGFETRPAPYTVDFRPDGEQMAVGGSEEILQLRDGDGGAPVELATATKHGAVQRVRFIGTGQLLVADDDGRVQLWDLATRTPVRAFQLPQGWVLPLAVSADGKRFAAGSRTGLIGVWELATGKRVAQLTGHAAAIRDLAFSADGARLASTATDHTVRIWDLAGGGAAPAPLDLATEGRLVAFLAGGGLLTVDEAGLIVAREPDGRAWQLFAAPGRGWVAIAPDGAVDGDEAGLRNLRWRTAGGAGPDPARTRRARRPGLLGRLPR
jgi:WD40 repeat protein